MSADFVTREELHAALHELEVRLDTKQARLEERMGNLIADMKGHVANFVSQLHEAMREARVQRAEILSSNQANAERMVAYMAISDATHAQVDRNGRQLDRALEGLHARMESLQKGLDKLDSDVVTLGKKLNGQPGGAGA